MKQNIIDELKKIVGELNIRFDELMAEHTTFKIGGPAQIFLTPHTTEEIGAVVKLCHAEDIPLFILGNGSNLLVSDEGMEGVVLQLYDNFSKITVEGNRIKAEAGALLSKIGNIAKEASLTGFEFAAGIPGTLGGAVRMNAGAYGGEMKDIITTVWVMDQSGQIMEYTNEQMEFSYRHSNVEEKGYLVVGAEVTLEPGKQEAISARMKELAFARREKQPLEYPSAGSTFKRPEGYFAGKLIMDSGLCGYQVGGAQVAEKHCGFVINKGGATAKDVMQLVSEVKNTVYETFQVELEPEIRMVGKTSN